MISERFFMKRWLFLGLVLVFSPFALAAEVRDDPRDIIFILDASVSMSDRIYNRVKMNVVKTTSMQIIADLAKRNNVGVMAYGHRHERDCDDVETLVSIKGATTDALGAAIQKLQPKGKTPLTTAVRQAAEGFSTKVSNASIVLIADGLETCGGDICALGRELAVTRTGLKTHIVGFDLNGQNTSALQCLAVETGGTYTNANSREVLVKALKNIAKEIENDSAPALSIIAPPAILTTPATVLED